MDELVETRPDPVIDSSPVIENLSKLDDPRLFINRELSMLEFQRRVLEEAQDESNPLLERVKFLGIIGSNLDEFFMVRVAGLRKQVDAGVVDLPPDGKTPTEQLAAIRKTAWQLMAQARETLREDILPQLRRVGIHVLSYAELTERQKQAANQFFEDVVFPVLTPLAFDPAHPFPHISNLSLSLAVEVRDINGQELFARVKVPDSLPRLLPLKRSSGNTRKDGTLPHNHYFVWLEEVIAANLEKLFPGLEVVDSHPFRVTRDADMTIQELEAEDLLETMEQSVRQRRFGSVVRVTVNTDMPARIRDILAINLEIDQRDIYSLDGPLGMSDVISLSRLDRPDLKDPPFKPVIPVQLRSEVLESAVVPAIRKEDILLHHPYESFTPVIDFLRDAAQDPDVLAIKQTLYRVGRNSPVVKALLEARQNGKQVAVLVELKARFDEESNIKWAHMLENEGVHVIYGLLGLKTHSKIALVIRKEGEQIRRYVHLATGNYNAVTAQLYEDIGMFTCDPEIGADATDLFNYLTGYSAKREYRKLLVAPVNLRERMQALILREINLNKKGKPGRLILKMNSLVDPLIIQHLYRASQAGVQIDLIVRGICCLRPGIPGISDNIRVISVVGRFLEHSRIYYFYNGGREEIYLGSADLMPRNIDRRVEVLFPVQDERIIRYLRDDVLATYLISNVKTRRLTPDGSYEMIQPAAGEPVINVQNWLLNFHRKSLERGN
jgi:polyphosphate kinase